MLPVFGVRVSVFILFLVRFGLLRVVNLLEIAAHSVDHMFSLDFDY